MPDLRSLAFVDYLKPAVLLSINTGLRQGELLKLNWQHVNLDRAILTVIDALAKSGKQRHIPLNDEALATLKAWRQQQTQHSMFSRARPEACGPRKNRMVQAAQRRKDHAFPMA